MHKTSENNANGQVMTSPCFPMCFHYFPFLIMLPIDFAFCFTTSIFKLCFLMVHLSPTCLFQVQNSPVYIGIKNEGKHGEH